MTTASDKHLRILESELRFITRAVNSLQTSDFEAVDDINRALRSAKQALEEYGLSLQPAHEDIPADVPLAA